MEKSVFPGGFRTPAMEFSTFTVILTDRCNFHCSYCYQARKNLDLGISPIAEALDFLFPRFTRDCTVNFYGGEPLLAYETLRRTVVHLQRLNRGREKRVRYALSTNGSLLTEEALEFLDEHSFHLLLSFDGWAQDIGREDGSFDRLVSLIPAILKHRKIALETNSVFTARTIRHLASSVRLILDLGVPRFHAGVSIQVPWHPSALARLKREIAAVRGWFLERYDRLADIPWVEMAKTAERGVQSCDAGRGQLALAADGRLWGCFLFPHYFDGRTKIAGGTKYGFGKVGAFLRDPEAIYARVMSAIAGLWMANARTPERHCVMCDEIESCWVCPVAAAFLSGEMGIIASRTCGMAKFMRREKEIFAKGFLEKRRAAGPAVTAAGFSREGRSVSSPR